MLIQGILTASPVPGAKEAVVNKKCSIFMELPLFCRETKIKKELEEEKALKEEEEGEEEKEGKRRRLRKKKEDV